MPLVVVALGAESVSYVRTGEFARLSNVRSARAVGALIAALLIVVWLARFGGAFGGPAPV